MDEMIGGRGNRIRTLLDALHSIQNIGEVSPDDRKESLNLTREEVILLVRVSSIGMIKDTLRKGTSGIFEAGFESSYASIFGLLKYLTESLNITQEEYMGSLTPNDSDFEYAKTFWVTNNSYRSTALTRTLLDVLSVLQRFGDPKPSPKQSAQRVQPSVMPLVLDMDWIMENSISFAIPTVLEQNTVVLLLLPSKTATFVVTQKSLDLLNKELNEKVYPQNAGIHAYVLDRNDFCVKFPEVAKAIPV